LADPALAPALPGASRATVSVLMVNYNTADLLIRAVQSLKRAANGIGVQIIVVDNASADDSIARIAKEHPDVTVIENRENAGFGRACNQALARASGAYVLLLNTDAFVAPDSLTKTLSYMEAHPRCGILGVKLVGADGRLQPSARYFPTPWNLFLTRTGLGRFAIFRSVRMVDDMNWDHASVRHCDWVPGCFYLVRRAVVDQIGLFDARYFLYYEEVDHCLAARKAGWEVVFYPYTTVVHLGGESARLTGEITPSGRQVEALRVESELLYFRKNAGVTGAWTAVFLCVLADAIAMLKRLLKGADLAQAAAHLRHALLVWRLFLRTGFGTRPTR
jgi:GT2 family glycosyltransferase